MYHIPWTVYHVPWYVSSTKPREENFHNTFPLWSDHVKYPFPLPPPIFILIDAEQGAHRIGTRPYYQVLTYPPPQYSDKLTHPALITTYPPTILRSTHTHPALITKTRHRITTRDLAWKPRHRITPRDLAWNPQHRITPRDLAWTPRRPSLSEINPP